MSAPTDDLAVSTSSLDGRDPRASIYQTAAKLFVNKQFFDAYSALEPLIVHRAQPNEPAWGKIWKLYLALVNNAAKQAAGSKSVGSSSPSSSDWPKKPLKDLSAKAQSGVVWDEAATAFGTVEAIPSDVVVTLLLVSAGYTTDLGPVSAKTELYLSSHSDPRITEAYVMKILPRRGEFEYAQELVNSNDVFKDKSSALLKLSHAQEAAEQEALRQATEKKRVEQLEKKRMEDSIASLQSEKEKPERPDRSAKAGSRSASGSGSGSVESLERVPSLPRTSRRSPVPAPGPRNVSSLVKYWRESFSEFLRQTSLMKLLLFIAVIILTVTNPVARRRLKATFNGVFTKLVETFRMGTKVSYI